MDTTNKMERQKLMEFIIDHPCAAVATYDGDEINLANAYVYVDGDLNLYFMSRPSHRKRANLERHPQLTLLCTDQEAVTQLECIGQAETVTDPATVLAILPKLQAILTAARSEYWVPPVAQIEDEHYALVKVTPAVMTYRAYATSGTSVSCEEVKLDFAQ